MLSNALKFTFKGQIKVKVEILKDNANILDQNPNYPKIETMENSISKRPLLNDNLLDIIDEEQVNFSEETISFRVSVSDTGIGIKDENKSKLFKLFGKIKQENRSINPQGIGLGLTICNRILEEMNSKLECESTFGQGTTFSFSLDLPFNKTRQTSQVNFASGLTEEDMSNAINFDNLILKSVFPEPSVVPKKRSSIITKEIL